MNRLCPCHVYYRKTKQEMYALSLTKLVTNSLSKRRTQTQLAAAYGLYHMRVSV